MPNMLPYVDQLVQEPWLERLFYVVCFSKKVCTKFETVDKMCLTRERK